MDELWTGLYKPDVYDADTLWADDHDSAKIARVIDAWSKGTALSPIFLIKNTNDDRGLVADGKHRLTVSRAIGALEVPFMVQTTKSAWVSLAFPFASRVH